MSDLGAWELNLYGCKLEAATWLVDQSTKGMSYEYKWLSGLGEAEYPLCRHTLKDGRIVDETVQVQRQVGRKIHCFIALKFHDGDWVPVSLWRLKEIEENLRLKK